MKKNILLLFLSCWLADAASVTTLGYNNARTKANLSETVLTQANVNRITRLGSYAVDGAVYAQPLTAENINGRTLLIVATMNDSIYAFDANAPGNAYIWKVSLGTPDNVWGPGTSFPNGQVGCLSTPVIDLTRSVVYAVCYDSGDWYLNALRLADGSTYHARVKIAGSVSGANFVSSKQSARAGLLLVNDVVYEAFGSYYDEATNLPYFGFIFGYNADTLAQAYTWCSTCTSTGYKGGGIWWSLAADSANNIYGVTGNGDWNGTTQYGMSFIKLSPALSLLSYFTPSDWKAKSDADSDMASSRAMLMGDSYLFGASKDGRMWVTTTADLGGLQGVGTGPAQVFTPDFPTRFENFVFTGTNLMFGGNRLERIPWNGNTLDSTHPVTSANGIGVLFGAGMSYSSNGNAAGSDILWATVGDTSAFGTLTNGNLWAVRPSDMTLLWATATPFGYMSKFATPTVVSNGMVYVPTQSNTVVVYGLPSSADARGFVTLRGKAGVR